MIKSIISLSVAGAAALLFLSACNKTAEDAPKIDAPTAPTAPDSPTPPAAVSAAQGAPSANSSDAPSAAADASVSASGTEARAGDVSVKLPN